MLGKVRSRFSFVGEIIPMKDKDKKEIKTLSKVKSNNKDWDGASFTCLIDTGENGRHRLKLFGGDMLVKGKSGKYAPFKFKVNDNEVEIKHEERFNEELLNKVPRYLKRTLELDEEKREYIYQLDFMNDVVNSLDDLKGKRVRVTGDISFSYNNEKNVLYKDFNIQSIVEVDDTVKPEAKATIQLFYTKDCIDGMLYEDGKLNIPYLNDLNNRVSIKCFVETKNTNKTLGVDDIIFPMEAVIDMNKIDFSNEKQNKIANFIIKNFILNSDGVYSCAFDCKIVNAQEQKSYTKDELEQLLTDEEREYAELFDISLDEVLARKQGDNVYGERINEIRLIKPNATLPVKTLVENVTEDMLALYKTITPQTVFEEEKSETPAKKEEKVESDEFEDLFG